MYMYIVCKFNFMFLDLLNFLLKILIVFGLEELCKGFFFYFFDIKKN